MQSTCISLWTQKYNKSKEPCISLTRRAAWLNMSFCPSVLCPAKFPHHGTSSQKPALIPTSSACSRWALAGQGKAGADQQNGLWESCGFQLLFKGWLSNMQAREDRVRLFSEVRQWTQTATLEILIKYGEISFHCEDGQRLDHIIRACGSSALEDIWD